MKVVIAIVKSALITRVAVILQQRYRGAAGMVTIMAEEQLSVWTLFYQRYYVLGLGILWIGNVYEWYYISVNLYSGGTFCFCCIKCTNCCQM